MTLTHYYASGRRGVMRCGILPVEDRKENQHAEHMRKCSLVFLTVGSANGSSDRLVGDPIIGGDFVQRFLVLNDPAEYCRPLLRRDLVARFGRTGMPMAGWWQRSDTGPIKLMLEHLLEVLREETGRGMEVDEHW